MPTQVVDFGEQAEHVDEFITHPAGYEGVFVASQDAEKKTRDGDVIGVEIVGSVDGANVREYLARYQDRDTGKMGFAAFRVGGVLTAFGLRKHGDMVNPTRLLDIRNGMRAPCKLKIHAYGKCKACGKAGAELADKAQCRCGGAIDRRERNEVDRWLEPDAQVGGAKQAGRQAETEASNDAWG
jgi:hypothetical protein